MRKNEFLETLRARLGRLPSQELEERLGFYSEMIDDRIEDGIEEEKAILDIGSVEEIAAQIIADIPLSKIAKERIKPKRRLKTWEILLLVLGSPLWLSLGIAAVAVMLSIYVVLWSLIISVWAIFASFSACAFGGIAAGCTFIFGGNTLTGIAMIGAGTVCIGLAIFTFVGCKTATRGIIILTKKLALVIKKIFVGKDGAK